MIPCLLVLPLDTITTSFCRMSELTERRVCRRFLDPGDGLQHVRRAGVVRMRPVRRQLDPAGRDELPLLGDGHLHRPLRPGAVRLPTG